jgi:hypothetical protein
VLEHVHREQVVLAEPVDRRHDGRRQRRERDGEKPSSAKPAPRPPASRRAARQRRGRSRRRGERQQTVARSSSGRPDGSRARIVAAATHRRPRGAESRPVRLVSLLAPPLWCPAAARPAAGGALPGMPPRARATSGHAGRPCGSERVGSARLRGAGARGRGRLKFAGPLRVGGTWRRRSSPTRPPGLLEHRWSRCLSRAAGGDGAGSAMPRSWRRRVAARTGLPVESSSVRDDGAARSGAHAASVSARRLGSAVRRSAGPSCWWTTS